MTTKVRIALTLILTIVYTAALLIAGTYSGRLNLPISNNTYLNAQFSYQILLVGIAGLSLLSSYFLNKENFTTYFSFGKISGSANELKAFGIKQGDSWAKTGISLCVVITVVTATFMYFQLRQSSGALSSLQAGLFWIILFSFTNSFGEEMIYRLGIVSPLNGLFAPKQIFMISAVLFGLPHFAGMPNGIVGATLAGVLGYVLAKSLYETKGLFWAWTIHFFQDLIIIGTFFVMNSSTK